MHRKINDFFGYSLPRLITLPWGWFFLLLAWICTACLLYYHQPFIEQEEEIPFFRGTLFGFTAVGIDLYLLLFVTMPRLFDPYSNCTHWTLGREISHLLLYYLLLLIFIQVYISRGVHGTDSPTLFHVLGFTFLSYILPVTGLTFFRLTIYLLQQRLSQKTVDTELPHVSIRGQMLDFSAIHGGYYAADDTLFIKVIGNYCYLNYLSAGRQVVINLKISLTKMQGLLKPYPQFVKCHYEYIVNTDNIVKFTGTKRKMKLQLHKSKTRIPVSSRHANELIWLIKTRT